MDAMLIEKTGDILPSLAQAVGGAVFKDYFQGFLPLLVKRTVIIRGRISYQMSSPSYSPF